MSFSDQPDPRVTAADYDRVAREYADEFWNELERKPFDREVLQAFAEWAAPGPVADLGCGPGHIGAGLAGCQVIGIDLSAGMIEEARRRLPEGEFRVGDLRDLPLDDASVRGVTAFYCLIHLDLDGAAAAIAEMARVLQPGGRALIALHRGIGIVGRDDWYGKPVTMRARLYEIDELTQMAEDAGLEPVEVLLRPPYDFEWPSERLYLTLQK